MFDYLESIDRSIVLQLNSCHTPFLDEFFWYISKTIVWIPFYLLALYFVWKKYNLKTTLLFLVCAILMIALVDSTTTYLFKETIQRYRPSHNLLLEGKLHFYQKSNGEFYRGGQYGFFSSHAANNTALAWWIWFFLGRFFKLLKWILIIGVLIIGLSRIYLTAHYATDVFCGIIWGSLWAFVIWRVSKPYIKETI